MKKNIFRISIAVLFIAVVAACIFACNKEKVVKEQTNPTSNSKKALFTPESYNWIHSELSNATLNYLESLKEDENVNHDLLYSILLKTLNQKGLNYPLKKTIINERVLEYAMRIDDIFTIPYDFYVIEYQKIMNSMTNDYDLCYEDKMQVAVFAECQLACKDVIKAYTISDSKEQLPRTNYTSNDGDCRFERQMSACMKYKYDGHDHDSHSSRIRALVDLITSPLENLLDLVECAGEIVEDLWNHVK